MKDVFLILRGKLDWAKLTGTARPHTGLPKYDKGPNWSVDITPDAKSRKLLSDHGLDKGGQKGTGKLRSAKGNDDRKETFVSLKHLENRADGTKNDPPRITDIQGRSWDGSLIGNGTIADVKVKVVDYGPSSDKGMYLQAVRILNHIPYEREEFEALSEDDEFFGAEEAATGDESPAQTPMFGVNDFDLDDDIPF